MERLQQQTPTAKLTDEQKALCQRYNTKVEPPLRGSKMGVALKSLPAKPVRGVRHMPSKDTNGWYIWAGEHSSDSEFYQSVSARQP